MRKLIFIVAGDVIMQFMLYTDVHEFYQDTYDVFMRHEAQNMIPHINTLKRFSS